MSAQEWEAAREELLVKEKERTRRGGPPLLALCALAIPAAGCGSTQPRLPAPSVRFSAGGVGPPAPGLRPFARGTTANGLEVTLNALAIPTPRLLGPAGGAPRTRCMLVSIRLTGGIGQGTGCASAAVVSVPPSIDARRPLVFAAVLPIAERHLADLRALSRSGAVLTTRTFSTSRAPQLCGRRRAPAPSSPVGYLPGGLQTIVRGERPGGLRYAIVGERYVFQRRIAFSLAVNTTQLPRAGQGPAGSSSSSFNPGQTRGALSLSATVVCAPGPRAAPRGLPSHHSPSLRHPAPALALE